MVEKEKTISLVGLSPIGVIVLELLSRKGMTLRVIDRGRVEEEDVKSSTLFFEKDITKFKVKEAKKRLTEIDAKIQMKSFHEEVSEGNVFLVKANICIDASNSEEVNKITLEYCMKNNIPIAVLKVDGNKVSVLTTRKKVSRKIFEDYVKREKKEAITEPSLVLGGAYLIITAALNSLTGNKKNYIVELDSKNMKTKIKNL